MGKEIAARLPVGRRRCRSAGPGGTEANEANKELSRIGPVGTVKLDLFDEGAVDQYIATLDVDPATSVSGERRRVVKPLPFLDYSKADYAKYADINRSMFFITQAVARNMKRHGGGSIVNIGSMRAKRAIKATPSSAYSAKAGFALVDSAPRHGAAIEFASTRSLLPLW